MNVLLTSAGRRTSLVNAFRACVHESGGRVWAGDTDPMAPALQVADEEVILPPIGTAAYLPTLLDLIQKRNLDLVVPLIDPGLKPLACVREEIREAGCQLLLSSSPLLDLTLDTWKTLQYFSQRDVRTPSTWVPHDSSPTEWPDPVFVKPRRGSGSTNARQVSKDNLPPLLHSIEEPLIQEVIEAPEMTVDALFDFDGTLIHYVPRLRIRTVGGESIQGRTLPDEELGSWLRPLLREIGSLGARGVITVQAFLTDPEPTLSEINARFGGGFPLTLAAGGHYPSWILDLCRGDPVEPQLGNYQVDLCMTRAYTEWFFDAATCSQQQEAVSGEKKHG